MSKSTKLGIFGKSLAGLGIVTAIGAGAVAVNQEPAKDAKSSPADHQDSKQDLSSITDRINKADEAAKSKTATVQAATKTEATDAQNTDAKTNQSVSDDKQVEVQVGDTLWGIASQNNVSLDALMTANPNMGTVIHPGDKITIPSNGSNTGATETPAPSNPNQGETSNQGSTGPNGTTNGGHTGSQEGEDGTIKPGNPGDNNGGNTGGNNGGNVDPGTPSNPGDNTGGNGNVDPSNPGDNNGGTETPSADELAKAQAAKDAQAAFESAAQTNTNVQSELNNAQANVNAAADAMAAAQAEAEQAAQAAKDAQAVASEKENAQAAADAAAQAAQAALDAANSEAVAEKIAEAQAALDAANAAKAEMDQAAADAANAANQAAALAADKNASVAETQAAAEAAKAAEAQVAEKAAAAAAAVKAAQEAVDAANQALADAKEANENAHNSLDDAINEEQQIGERTDVINVDEAGNAVTPDAGYKLMSTSSTTEKDYSAGSVSGQYVLVTTTTNVYHKMVATENSVTINVDEAGNEITPSDKYVKVSESTETNTVTADNGDTVTTHTTTVVWHELTSSEVIVNVDEDGNAITPSDEYKLISTSTEKTNSENGDVVITITNVYHKIVTTVNESVVDVDEDGNAITPSDEYVKVGETVVTEERHVADNGDVTINRVSTTTYHKIKNTDKTESINVDEQGNKITPDSGYKLMHSSSETKVEKLPNGDTVTTIVTTNVYHKIVNKDVHVNQDVDEKGNVLTSTEGMVKVGVNNLTPKVEVAENGDTVTTYVINTVWHMPKQIGDTNYSDRLIDSNADGGYTVISGTPDLRYYKVDRTETRKTNVQANGDYTLETVTYYTLTEAGFQNYLNEQMADALAKVKAELWAKFPDVAKDLESKGNSLGVTAMTAAEQAKHGGDAQAAANQCAKDNALSHSNYGDMGQIIARGGYFLEDGEDPFSPEVAQRMIDSAISAYMQEMEALEAFLNEGKEIGEYGHLIAIMSMQESYTAATTSGSKGYIATNWI